MEIPKSTDVVIVGGGPAGVMAAYVLAKQGKSVVILDKKKREKIGDKTCGEALDKPAPILFNEKLNIEFPTGKELPSKVSYLTFAAKKIKFQLKAKTPAYITDRLEYGQRLLQEAEDNGAVILSTSIVRELLIEGDQITGVKYTQNREARELKCKIVIDSSGFVGIIRKEIPGEMKYGIPYLVKDEFSVATYREIVEFAEPHNFQEEILLYFIHEIPIPGYAWIFTSGEKRLNIGLTWPKNVPYPEEKSLKEIYHEIFDKLYPPQNYTVIKKGGGQIPIQIPFDSLVFNGAMLTGDSACLVNPVTAEGHSQALESGYYAGNVAYKALMKNSYRKEDLWDYNVQILRTLGRSSAMSLYIQEFFKKVGINGLAKFLKRKFITQADLERIFQNPDSAFSRKQIAMKTVKMFPRVDLLLKLKQTLGKIEIISNHYRTYPEDPSKLKQWIETREKLLTISH